MLNISGADHLNLEVHDLSETLDFYADLFGFKILKEQPEENSLIIGNDQFGLCIYETGYKQDVIKGFHHFGFHVQNFDDILPLLEQKNIPVRYGGILKWEKSESIYIADPNGYEIELSRVWGGGLE
jgi:catechol 2,3-dioxygenase-like lactoylglutathione lyase family enzyme